MEVSNRQKVRSSSHKYSRERDRDRGHERGHHHRSSNKDYEFDFADISRASTPTSTFSSKSEGQQIQKRERERDREHKYSSDDYRRKIARLKSELELEKAKSKKAHKEKSSEMREIRETYELQKQSEINGLEHKMKKRLEKERRLLEENLRNTIMEEKDKELQDVLKYKEEELRELKKKYKHEKESAIKLAINNEKHQTTEKERELGEQIDAMKRDKQKLEMEYKKKVHDEAEREKEMAKIKEDYDGEMRRVITESKKFAMVNLEKLRKAEKALSEHCGESDDELNEMEFDELMADLQHMQSQASSRAVSTTSELKFDEINMHINTLLASPAVTPGPLGLHGPMTPGIQGQLMDGQSPLTVKNGADGKRSSSVMSEPARELFMVPNRKQEERDRQLQKKVSELQTQSQRLERKIALLKTENETLKRKQDDKKPLEEKIKTLKKRNAELAAIARRLEEKAKHLQQENFKKAKEMLAAGGQQTGTGIHNSDQMKKMFARQRAKDLAEHAKHMLAKDREIEDLRSKCQELADQLSNSDFLGPDNCEMYEEKEELVSIIKQAAKERLSMERQLAIAKPGPDSKLVSAEKYKELEDTNETLKKEIVKLGKVVKLTEQLEADLVQSREENVQLTDQISDLRVRLTEFSKVNEECSTLRLSLSEAQRECEVAKGEVSVLHLKVQNLETVVQNLEFSTEKLKQVETDYHDALHKLQNKQQEIDSLQKVQESAREKYETAIKSLQDKIHRLESQCLDQASKQQELTDEITQLRAQAVKKSQNICSAEIQTGNSLEFAPSSTSSPNQSPRSSPGLHGNTRNKSPATHINTPSNSSRISPGLAKSSSSSGRSPSSNKTPSPSHVPIINKGANFAKRNSQTPESVITPPVQTVPPLQLTPKKINGFLEQSESTKSGGTDTDKGEDSGMESRGDQRGDREVSEISMAESRLSVLAKKGPIQVYIAKYSYDPHKYSPNENPEAELPLQAGDYVLIYGEMDEDGFFDGESIDGRRGLVPSNFIEKVADDDLPEFHAAMAQAAHEDDSTAANSIAVPDLDSSEELDKSDGIPPDTSLRLKPDPSSDLENIDEEDEEDEVLSNYRNAVDSVHIGAPFPKSLQLDRQLANSILVSWSPPDDLNPADVRSYHVFLDGDFKMAIRGSERTKSLLENVESRKIHRVSVRCISSMGQSHDNQCTILVGKDVIPAPFDLRLYDITANSATISWTPGDSQLHHAIFVNNVEVRVVKPAVCTHTLTGLVPATNHAVKIQAKNLAGGSNNIKPEKLTAMVDFITANGGAPDPPVNVQVETGPQEGSILLTWLPVTIDTTGFSNGALVAGYMVYADGQKVKQVLGATNDHSILSSEDFHGFVPKELFVVSVTKDKMESPKSEIVRLPQNLIKEITMGAATATADTMKQARKSPLHGRSVEDELNSAFEKINQVYQEQEEKVEANEREVTPRAPVVAPPVPASREKQTTPASAVPHIEITRDDTRDGSHDRLPSNDASKETAPTVAHSDSKPVRNDSIESSKSTKLTSQQSDSDNDVSKYSARMDSRDGYRDGSSSAPRQRRSVSPSDHSNRDNSELNHRQNGGESNSELISASKQQHSNANHKQSARGKSVSPARRSSPRASPHARESPLGKESPSRARGESPSRARQSPRGKESPRGRSSPRTSDKLDGPRGPSPRDGRKASASPQSKGKNSASHRSPVPSPNAASKTNANAKPQQQHLQAEVIEPLELSSIDKTHDTNYVESDDDSITGEINPPVDDNRVRLFVALFDYDPESMSPNVDSLDEELPFREGNIIKVYGDKDADGFYRGECGGRVGYIPCNMVSEIQVDDPELEEQLLREVQDNGSVANPAALSEQLTGGDKYLKPITSNGVHASGNEVPASLAGEVAVRRMIAMYDYDPQELSPNVDAEVELSFKSGDIIITYGEMDDDGFYMGEKNGQRGLVPSNFLQECGASDEEVLDSVSVVTPASNNSTNNHHSTTSNPTNNNSEVQAPALAPPPPQKWPATAPSWIK